MSSCVNYAGIGMQKFDIRLFFRPLCYVHVHVLVRLK